ncbi:MAG: CPBP family intramembrane metalloprotease [Defluviitaleaceae bacterium]|nr:CPBP family intramembrane metalloprotease [Defluviitaleaceae bacterium]
MQSPARANKAIFFLIIWILPSSFLLLIFGVYNRAYQIDPMIASGLVTIVAFFVPASLYKRITKWDSRAMLPSRGLSLKNALIVAVLSFAVMPVMHIVSFVSSFVFMPFTTSIDVTGSPILLGIIVFGVLPSIGEEFWFRGVMYTEYRAKGVPILKTAIITGVMFGLMHMNFRQAIYATVLGVLLAYLVYYTGSILAPMLAHFINNGMFVILSHIESYQRWYGDLTERPALFLLVMGVASLVMLPVLVLCMRHLKKHCTITDVEISDDAKPKVYTWGLWAALAFCIVMALIMEVGMRVIEF